MFSKILDYLNNLNIRQVFILAGVSAILMFGVIYLFLTQFTTEKVEPTKINVDIPRVTTVVVAKADIAPRLIIQSGMVQVKEIPSDTVPNGAITTLSEVVGHPAKITILAGDVITKRKLHESDEQAGFVGSIPPDCRAISINVNNVTGVSGFAKPGDYVDLLLAESNNNGATTSIILQNVLLLSINKNMNRSEIETEDNGGKNAAIDSPNIATVALKPQDALKLVSAAKLGDIYMMLRPNKPLNSYVDEIDYTIISSNAPPKKEETPKPAQPVEEKPVEKKPVEEPKPEPEPERKIEIIYGAEIQPSESDKDNKKESNSQ